MILLLALVVAAAICGIMWRRPDARAAASGAWQAGKAQAVAEFRAGYEFAQQRLRAGNPRVYNPRRWLSWGLAGAYGTCKTVAAANRIRRSAWEGGRDRYEQWKASRPVDAEVIEDHDDADPAGDREQAPPVTGTARCPRCGELCTITIPAGEVKVTVVCPCGHTLHAYLKPPDDPPAETPQPEDPGPTGPDNQPGPAPGPETTQEDTVQTEATGLASYAAAHDEIAQELRERMSGSESLAASMANILAEHSDLIGDTAVLQDHLNQAAGIADRIAERARAVAAN